MSPTNNHDTISEERHIKTLRLILASGWPPEDEAALKAGIAALEGLAARSGGVVKVKSLEWADTSGQDEDGGYDVVGASADHPLAHYWITYADMRRDEIWLLMRDRGHVVGHYMKIEEAKAAAQSDFEQRVRSCLSTIDDEPVTTDQHPQPTKAG